MTVREVVSQVRSAFKMVSADVVASNRYILSELKTVSMEIVVQELNKRKYWSSPNLFTVVDCIPMENVPLTECCSFSGECKVSRSIEKLPPVVECSYNNATQGVWTIDKKIRFDEMDVYRFANAKALNSKKDIKAFWLVNNYLYISKPDIETVSGAFYFVDFIDPRTIGCGTRPTCPVNPMDLEFKTLPGRIEDIVTITYKKILETYKGSKEDSTDDDKDDSQ